MENIQYVLQTNQENYQFSTTNPEEAARRFHDLPGSDLPRITRIEHGLDAQGKPFDRVSHPAKTFASSVIGDAGKVYHEFTKSVDARDTALQAAFVAEGERRSHPAKLTLDGQEVSRIEFHKYQFTEHDHATADSELTKGTYAYDARFILADGTTQEYKHLFPDVMEAAVGEINIAEIETRKGMAGVLRGKSLHVHEGISPEKTRAHDFDALTTQQQYGENFIECDSIYLIQEDVVSRAAAVRAQERAARETNPEEIERLGHHIEEQGQKIESLGHRADLQEDIALKAAPSGDRPNLAPVTYTEREIGQQAEAMERVYADFRAAGSNFYFRDSTEKLAFKDGGNKLVSACNDERVAFGMANMAEARGWTQIKVNGHPDFRQKVWMECALKGIVVKGYNPTEQDKVALEARQNRQMRNSIEKLPTAQVSPRRQVAEAVAAKMLCQVKDPKAYATALARIKTGLQRREDSQRLKGIGVFDHQSPAMRLNPLKDKQQQHHQRDEELAR